MTAISSRGDSPAAAARAWMEEFAACVRRRDIDAGRRLFDPACSSFGARAERLGDLDDLVARQWHPTWTTTRGFVLVDDSLSAAPSDDGSLVVAMALWTSDGVRDDRTTFPRRGRCTVVLRADAEARHGLLAIHTHFSLDPETGDPADRRGQPERPSAAESSRQD